MRSLDISASALEAQRVRMEVISHNLANAETTRASKAPDGTFLPYRRRQVVFQTVLNDALGGSGGKGGAPAGGVRVSSVEEDPSAFRMKYAPGHPDADASGYVRMPNVDGLLEMVDLMEASRAYEANITAMEASKSIAAASLRLLA